MIFQTIQGENGNTQIVTSLKARAMSQQKAEAQLATDIQCLKEYEIACNQAGITTQELASKLEGASVRAQEYAVQIKNATGTAQMYAQNNAVNTTASSSIGSKIISKILPGLKELGAIAGNVIGYAIISFVFDKVTDLIVDTITKKQKDFEKLQNKYKDSSEKVQKNKEESKSLDELIKKYKELSSVENIDTSTRNEIKQVQYDIAALVGKQASNLDLVNGKLDDQLSKLKEIENQNNEDLVDDSKSNYYNVKNVENNARGNAKSGNDVVIPWSDFGIHWYSPTMVDDIDKKLDELNSAAKENIFRRSYTPTGKLVVDTKSLDIDDKIEALTNVYEYLCEQGEQESNLAVGINSAIENYKSMKDDSSEEIKSVVESLILQYSNGKIINDVESYEDARKQIISSLLSDDTIKEAINEGDITEDILKSTVNSVISTLDGFGIYYDEWKKKYLGKTGVPIEDETMTVQDEVLGKIDPSSLWVEKSNKKGRVSSDRKSKQFNYNIREKYYKELKQVVSGIDDLDTLDVMNTFSDTDWNNIIDRAMNGNRNYSREDQIIEAIGDYVYKKIQENNSNVPDTSPTTFSDMFIVADDNDSTKTELIESYQKLFTNIENVKTAFQTLKSAQEEYNTSGSLSIDTIKSLMETGDDWLNYLTVEDGQLKINEQGYVDLAKAKLNALKTEMYTSIQKQIEGLQNAGQANDWVNEQNGNLANSYDDLTSSIKASTLATLENKLATADDDAEKQKWQSAIESAKNAFDKIDKLVNDQNPIETGVTVTGSDSEFSNRINQIKEHASLINSISDDIKDKGKITMDTLTSISSAFPKLESYIEDYMNGVEGSQEALTNALKECYEQDLENYKEYLKVKYTNDSSFWQQYVNNCGDSINQLANQYGIDLKNYSTYTEAMQVMNNKLIESNEAVANARRLAMNLMTGTATSSATVAGLNSTQKTAIDNVWQQLVNEYSSGQVSEDSYSTIEQRLLNLNLGINQNIAKNLAAQFRQQLVHLPKSTILDSLKTEVESGFDGYVANYVDNFDLSSLSLDSLKEDSSSSKEDFDWVETKINRLSEALERLKDKASDTYSTWSTRNASLQQAIATTQNAIDLQSQAYQTYMNKANSIGLSDTYKTLVQNGALRIDTIYDEDLKEKISDYQEWYDKAKDCLDTQRDLQDSLNELNSQKFENLQSEYDSLIESLEKQRDLLEGQITVLTSASTYNQLRNQQNNIIENLKAERNALSATLNSLSITRGSEEWTNLSSELTDIDQSLQDAYSKLQEISKLQFDNLKEYYELSIDLAEKQKDLAEGRINLLSSSSDYQNLANQQRSIIQMYEQELNQLNALKNSSVFNEMSYSDQMGTLSDLTDLNQTLDEAYDTLREISKLQFDNVKETFEFDTQKIEHYLQLLQDQTDLLETKGLFANEKYYNSMISYTQQKIDNLQKEKSQLQSILNNSSYQQGTSEWNDMFSALMDIDEELSSLNADMVEFNNNIRDLNWDIFEYLEESLSRITSETDYLVELLSKEDLYDKDTGEFTKYADATVGLHAAAYDVYKQQAQDYYEEVQDLQKQLVNGAGKDVLEQYNNMVDAHQDAVKSALEEKQAILDLIEQGYNAQLDALQELIDKKKEALNQEKNLHDYQKNVKDKTENIASLEKQKASLLNDASEDAMSKIQKIEASLKDAREDLQETEYEQYLQDSQDMLDQLAEDYEDWMNARLDQSDALLAEIVGKVGEQGGEIKNTLTEVADRNGTMLSESMNTIFSAESPFTSSLMNGIRDTSNNTVGAVNNLNTNVNNGINNINGNVTNGFTDVGNKISGTTTAINNLINKVADITNAVAKNTNAGSNTGGGNGGASGNTTSSGGSYSSTPSTPNYTPSYTPTHTTSNSGSSSGSNSSSNSGSSNNNSSNSSSGSGIFEYLKDSYPKDRLDINNSIVDRLKYRDYNSTFSARSRYWQKLGFSGTYTGSSAQNTKMLNWMKNHGYRKGTDYVPKNGYYPTQEEGLEVIEHNGALLTPLSKGDKVFNSEATQRLFDIANNEEFQKNVKLFTPSIDLTSGLKSVQSINTNNGGNRTITFGDTNVSIAQASNIEDIVDGLTKSKRFEDMICYVINEKSMGRSTVGKNRFVRH